MNEKKETPETLDAVLAEMRKAVVPMICGRPKIEAISIRDVLNWADRIEAAAKRERAPGNAAAMRDILELLKKRGYVGLDGAFHVPIEDISDQISAALAAPARNCDRFQTEREAWEFYLAHTPDNGNIVDGFPPWLFATEAVYGDAAESEGGAE